MKRQICQAFEAVHEGYSADRIVADAALNEKFIAACRSLGLTAPSHVLNTCLFSSRKGSLLASVRTTRRTILRGLENCQFASEIAARFLEQRSQVTLDQVLCDPGLAEEFDALTSQVAPGFSSLQYRWAALNLRKSKRLRPELIGQVVGVAAIQLGRVDSIEVATLPMEQGIYVFYSPSETLYVGECQNLRLRLKKHLEHSDIRAVAHHFWKQGTANVFLEVRVLPSTTSSRVRRALEAELIASRRAQFNIKRQ